MYMLCVLVVTARSQHALCTVNLNVSTALRAHETTTVLELQSERVTEIDDNRLTPPSQSLPDWLNQ